MKILVTGGAGFIGSNLVDALILEGHHVRVIDGLSTGKLSNLDEARKQGLGRFEFYNLDITEDEVVDLIKDFQPEIIYHLAAQADVRVSVNDPLYDAKVNVLGSLNILKGAAEAKAKRIIYAASGGTIYGDVDASMLPVNESNPKLPVSPYGISKGVVLDYLRSFYLTYGIEYVALALANVYGPRQDPHGEAGVIAIFADQVLNSKQSVIYGDGEQTRDFVFVDDVIDAFVKAQSKGDNLLINIGTSQETSVNRLYKVMCEAANKKENLVYKGARAGELLANSLDNTRALIQLSWRPWTSIEEGIAKTLEFMSKSR